MKKTKILLLFLTLVMLVSAFPIAGTFGDEVTSIGESDNGMVLNKTAVSNGDGTYTISLEAFATGTSFISNVTENVPTDIVIVVDQSGSMEDEFDTVVSSYSQYKSHTNNEFYTESDSTGVWREDLYYQLSNGSYTPVTLTRTYAGTYKSADTVAFDTAYSNSANGTQYYAKKNGQYFPVQIKRETSTSLDWGSLSLVETYKYTYTLVGDTSSKSSYTFGPYTASEAKTLKPRLTNVTVLGCDTDYLYTANSTSSLSYTYNYTYTDENGVEQTYRSEGSNTTYAGPALYYANGTTTRSRLVALKSALESFLADIEKNSKDAQGNAVQNRVAIVGFASGGNSSVANKDSSGKLKTYENTELFNGKSTYQYGSTTIDAQYGNAFKDTSTSAGMTALRASVGVLDASGATCVDLGLTMAERIFDAYKSDYSSGERNKVVVVFTDGNPGSGLASSDERVNANISTANNAIEVATELKNTYGTTVYTIGIQAGADPTSPGSDSVIGTATVEAPYANWFLHKISSNNGKVPSPGAPGYYLSASNTAELTSIFKQIAEQVQTGGTSIKLQEDTVIKDYVTNMFDLHSTTVTLETWHCTNVVNDSDGKTVYTWVKNDVKTHPTHENGAHEVISGSYTWSEAGSGNELGASYTIDYDKKLVSITGFNYSDNWVGTVEDKTTGTTTYRGNKIVLTFTVHPEEGFLGGNDVFTNTPDSGIYKNEDEDEPVDEFPVPDVDVTVPDVGVTEMPDITAAAHDIDVYLFESVTLDDIKAHTTVTVGGAKLDLSKDNYGLEAWQTEYVNLSIVYKDASGNTFTSYDNLTADTTYTVIATVTPKTEGTATAKTSQDTGSIWVYKPVLTYKDNVAYYGGPAVSTDWETDYLVSTAWKHGNTTARTDIMGQAPTLDKTYTWDSNGKITDGVITAKQDIPVDVSVKIGNSDVSQYVTFAHKDCSTGEDIGSAEFVVHVNTCSLTVSKTGSKDGEPCVFTVLKDGEYYTQVTLNGQTGTTVSKTLYELPVGTYSIAEDEAWSWRYDASYSGNGVTLSASKPSATISCTNTEASSSWLNYFSEIIENIFGVSKNAD